MAKEKKAKQSAGTDLGKKASKKDGLIDSGNIKYYPNATISCACGAVYIAGSTQETIRLDICANCHPFFTGESRIMDTEGRVEKFRKKYGVKSK